MEAKDSRPVYLNLFKFRFPLTAIVSICHRISGLAVLLGFPIALWYWRAALLDFNDFSLILFDIQQTSGKLILLVFATMLFFHFSAGIRHMLMDLGMLESELGGTLSSAFLLLLAVAFFAGLGFLFFF